VGAQDGPAGRPVGAVFDREAAVAWAVISDN